MSQLLSTITMSTKTHVTGDYQSRTIFETLCRINGRTAGAIYLPALQRHFVWSHDKICALFDSLMRDYPIGTFLFWEVDQERAQESSFYSFIQDFSEFRDGCMNKPAGRSLPPELIGVLDGQQRLNSMYVALLGSYAYYQGGKGCPKTSPAYYKQRFFYLNVFGLSEDDAEHKFQFQFLTDEEAAPRNFTADECWFRVGDLFYLDSVEAVGCEWLKFRRKLPASISISDTAEQRALQILQKLWEKIRIQPLITFYPVRNRSLTEALEIFVRMNHAGVPLHFHDLLFSTIVANWNDGRKEIEKLREDLEAVGHGFKFEVSPLMLACLVLSGNPIRMKIESFKPANVDRIRTQWYEIVDALKIAANLVHKWSYSGNNAVSLHAVIAVAIFVRHGIDYSASEDQLRLFFIRSVICGLYDRRAEGTLAAVRSYLEKKPAGTLFSLCDFVSKVELPSSLSLEITDDKLDDFVMTPISSPRAYVLLSLLHGQHALYQHAFEKDHVHPRSAFDDLTHLNLSSEREALWREWKDLLPNLQLLQWGENNNKRATAFKDWLPIYRPDDLKRKLYLAENHINEEAELAFDAFETFFLKRRELLRNRLHALLQLN